MASTDHAPEPKNFEPKEPVKLDPPKDDPITVEKLSEYDGTLYPCISRYRTLCLDLIQSFLWLEYLSDQSIPKKAICTC